MSNEANFEKVRKTVEDAARIASGAHTNGWAEEPGGCFTMGPKGLTVTQAKGEKAKILWIAAPFQIVGRVRDSQSEGWGPLT